MASRLENVVGCRPAPAVEPTQVALREVLGPDSVRWPQSSAAYASRCRDGPVTLEILRLEGSKKTGSGGLKPAGAKSSGLWPLIYTAGRSRPTSGGAGDSNPGRPRLCL
jgi:hypothetical protein